MTRPHTPEAMRPGILSALAPFFAVLIALTVFAASAPAQNPVPFLDQPLVPDATAPGGVELTLTVNGGGFVAASVVNWNGSPRATTFVSSSRLSATILASDIATASSAAVTVVNPSPGGGVSNTQYFSVAVARMSVSFAPAVPYNSGAEEAQSMVVADVNGDGKLDLVVANCDPTGSGGCGFVRNGVVGVLLGNGDGTFQPVVTYNSGGNLAFSVAVADVNGDGKPDLVVTHECTVSGCEKNVGVSVLMGNGDGTFKPAVTYNSGGEQSTSVAVADVNGDGKLDLLVTNTCPSGATNCNEVGGVSVLLGNGDGTFKAPVTYGSGGTGPMSIAAADINGDGKIDLVVANCGCAYEGFFNTGTAAVLLGNGDGTFQPAVSYGAGQNPWSVAVADVNADGKPDVLVADSCWCGLNASVAVLLGNGDGTLQPAVTYDSGSQLAFAVTVADVNVDGKPDLLVGSGCSADGNCDSADGSVGVLLGNGDGTFQPVTLLDSGECQTRSIAVADVNRDGWPDVLTTGCGTVGVLLNNTASTTPTPTTTTLASSLNPSVYGQSVTFPATVSSNAGTPTGTVELYNGSIAVGSGIITGGKTSISVSSLPVGSDSIIAVYLATAPFAASTSSPFTQTVSAATSSSGLTSSLNPAGTGLSVTFTATVASQYGGAATGSVTFLSGSQTLGTATLSGNRATLTTSFATAGTYSISARYSGDGNNAGSTSSTLSQVIIAATTTILASSLNPSLVGQAVTFAATVSSSGGTPPNGEAVTFYNGSSVLGAIPLSGGVASLTTSSLSSGTFTITASYAGDTNFAPSTSPGLRQVVNSTSKSATSTALVSNLNPSIKGQAITFTATVTSTGGTPPNGEAVTFFNGSNVLGTAPLAAGVASLTKSSLAAGIFTISAVYGGDGNFISSVSPSLQQVVDTPSQSPTATTLASSLNPSTYGQKITWTATVTTSGSTTPTGKVNFIWQGTAVGSASLNASGVATLTRSNLNADSYPLTAVYVGDANNGPSVSAILNQVITQATSTATLTSSPNPSTQGESVTFTAEITSPTTTPTGPVTFTVGKTTLGTVELSKGEATLTSSALPVGSTTVTVTYPWNSDIAQSSASVIQVVQQ